MVRHIGSSCYNLDGCNTPDINAQAYEDPCKGPEEKIYGQHLATLAVHYCENERMQLGGKTAQSPKTRDSVGSRYIYRLTVHRADLRNLVCFQ